MAGMLVHDLEALEVNENALIEVGSSQKYEWSVAAGSRFPDSVSCRQLLVGVTRLNSSLARLIFATSSDPSAHIPVLLAEDTTHSRIANKNLNHLPDCARTEYIKKHYVFVSGVLGVQGSMYSSILSAGQAPRGCSVEDNRGIEELQGKLLGRGVPFFLYNQNWKKSTKLFFTKQSKVLFSELPIAGNDIF